MAKRYCRVTILSAMPALTALWLLASAATHAQTAPDYKLQAGDQLEVSVWGEEDLKRTVILRPDGKFSFPLAGEVIGAGRSATDVQTEMTRKLVPYIPEAVVTVTVTAIDGNRIYVIGQVNKPGAYTMNPQLSVLQALSLAAGTTPFAKLNDIIVIRGKGTEQKVLRISYGDISQGKNLNQNIPLDSGDVVLVP
ncbi:MAG: polysaccharide biosynthesis/export family protein [Gammaproteobacteria bacterium]